jgi:ribosomal protein S18 acetylase RimI-like enzyme
MNVFRFTLRPFRPSDADACARVFQAAWRVARPDLPRSIDRDTFQRETAGERIVVAVDARREVVGFAALDEGEAFVHHLFVDPRFHRRGVGRTLLDEAARHAGRPLSLKCMVLNRRAMAFYRHIGWRACESGDDELGGWTRFASPRVLALAGSDRAAERG